MTDQDDLMTCATWNLHRTVGRDGRADADRIAHVIAHDIARQGPLILALQEADSDDVPPRGLLDLARLCRATGLRSVHDAADMRCGGTAHGYRGNILLLNPAMTLTARMIQRLPGRYARAAVIAEVRHHRQPLRIVACHLALSQILRVRQMRAIGLTLAQRAAMPTVLLGDLNEWRPWGGLMLHTRVTRLSLTGPHRRTFPVHAPLLALDRVLAGQGLRVVAAGALDSPAIRAASDHRPLVARIARIAA